MTEIKGAGRLRERLHFQRRQLVDDGFGNEQAGDWIIVFTTAAELKPLKGSEPVIASRLSGVQPFVIQIRSCSEARGVTTAWRAVDARNPSRIFNITSMANFDEKNAYLDLMAVQGVAT
ncbi:head-tail adaptor protein [Rhizobium sp. NLR10a]|uniref:head-tail adaptor protein n=1 Tax=unclassified Rhizobium TaxID=2613769 RepID=UPI001C83065F|nr:MULTISPECIES: head-tail adaptor protein [unclassified Rhizobium]MBX5285178.1 head-tail adaptor protein [Rhizobium sp. NLR10a]MBX5293050.1 head-tail adaptor protein [Rhizobium sp. NLR15a]